MSLTNKINALSQTQQSNLLEKLRQRYQDNNALLTQHSDKLTSLVSYVVLDDDNKTDANLTIDSIVNQLHERLPAYMVPNNISFLHELPHTSRGKIDKAKLASFNVTKDVESNLSGTILYKDQIQDKKQKELLNIWQKVLGLSQIQTMDDFFELGGDSILAIELVSAVRQYGIPMKVSELFKYRTVASLCQHFDGGPLQVNSHDKSIDSILQIWKTVLGTSKLQYGSNFFQSGGDSILAISLISQMKKNNFNVSISQLFKFPTVSSLATQIIGDEGSKENVDSLYQMEVNGYESTKVREDAVTSEVIFSPIQSWFFENNFQNTDHWNQSILLEISPNINFDVIEIAFSALYRQYDALRLSVTRHPTKITQRVKPFSDCNLPIEKGILKRNSIETFQTQFIDASNSHHSRLKLSAGNLLRGTFFNSEDGGNGYLLLVAHHFCVDAVSWRILINTLNAILQSPGSAQRRLNKNSNTSFQTWANALQRISGQNFLEKSYQFWVNQDYQRCSKIPLDFGNTTLNIEKSSTCLELCISEDISAGVMSMANSQDNSTVQLILLAALSVALKEWLKFDHLLIGIEGHGREDIDPALESESVVGWLTSYFPLVLDLQYSSNFQQTLNEVQEQFLAIPDKGLSFGLGRYLNLSGSQQQALVDTPMPEIIFNYLGRTITDQSTDLPAKIIEDTLGINRDPRNLRSSVFEINAIFENDQLLFKWQFSDQLHHAETIQSLLDSLSKTLTGLVTGFRSTQLAQSEDAGVYPLSEIQQSFLFHRLSNVNSDQGELLLSGELHGELSLRQFTEAWHTLVSNHSALRATVDWKEQSIPKLIVHQESRPEVKFIDLSDQSENIQISSVKQLLAQHKKQLVDIEDLPGMGLTLIKQSDQLHTFIWACHHLFLDGWSSAIVLQDLIRIISQQSPGNIRRSTLHDYYRYMDSLALSRPAKFWKNFLGNSEKCLISNSLQSLPVDAELNYRGLETKLFDDNELNELKALAKTLKVTPSVILAGCWSLTLANLSGLQSICFGLTLSGRNHPIENVPLLVANLANVVPYTAEIDFRQDLSTWLEEFMLSQEAVASHGQYSVGQIMSWSGLDSGAPLFDTVLSIANYPSINSSTDLQLKNYLGDATTIHPLSIFIIIGDEISFDFDYSKDAFSVEMIDCITDLFFSILKQVKAEPFNQIHSFVDDAVLTDYEELLARHKPVSQFAEESPTEINRLADTNNHTDTESTLLSILKTVLDNENCRVHDSFFDLGGTSLQAIRYFSEIENSFHKKLPMASLFLHPSVSLLATLIDGGEEDNSQYKNLVQIQSGGNLPPIFLLHAAGLDILFYKDLTKHLDSRIPLYGLLPVGHDGSEEILTSVEEMAKRYVAEIRSVYPSGPYILVGHCFGFTIAYEIANLLLADGATVPLVVSIDGPAPLPEGYVNSDWVPPLQRGPWQILKGVGRVIRRLIQHKILWRLTLKKGNVKQRTELLIKRNEYAFGMAFYAYRAKPIKAKILSLICSDSINYKHNSKEDWQCIAPEAMVVKADCLHVEILVEPYVKSTASVIMDSLSKLDAYKNLVEPSAQEWKPMD